MQTFNFLASLCSWGDVCVWHFDRNPGRQFCWVEAKFTNSQWTAINSLLLGNILCLCDHLLTIFSKLTFKHYQSVKRFGSRSGPTFWRQKLALARKAKVPLFNPCLANMLVMKILSADYICCINLNASTPNHFYHGCIHYEPWSDCS